MQSCLGGDFAQVSSTTQTQVPQRRREKSRHHASASRSHLAIKVLQHVEGFLSLSLFGNQPLAIETILQARQVPVRRAKIFQNPRAGAAQERNLSQRGDLMR